MGGPLYFCIRYVGFEPEGSWKRAGGTFQPEAACPAGQVESLRVHHVGASCISLAPTFYAFGKKVRVRSFRCSSLAKLQPLALGCSLVLRGMTLDVISFAATFSLLEQTSLLTHSVAAPLKPGPADAGLRVCFLWFSLCDRAFYFMGNRKHHPLRSLAPPFPNRTRAMHWASIWGCGWRLSFAVLKAEVKFYGFSLY